MIFPPSPGVCGGPTFPGSGGGGEFGGCVEPWKWAFLSASLAGVTSLGSALAATLAQVKDWHELNSVAIAICLLGALVNFSKDLHTRFDELNRLEREKREGEE